MIPAVHLARGQASERPPVTPQQALRRARQREWVRAAKFGDRRAAALLVEDVERLTCRIARECAGMHASVGHLSSEDFEDMKAQARLSILESAIDKFDLSTPYAWTTYVTHWIRAACNRWLDDHSRAVRVPTHVHDARRRLRRAARVLRHRLGREPVRSELLAEANVSEENFARAAELGAKLVRMDAPAWSEGSAVRGDFFIFDEEGAEARVVREEQEDLARRLLLQLRPNERLVLEQRCGIGGGECRTFKQIGEQLGLSRERVRQIEEAALARMRRLMGRVG